MCHTLCYLRDALRWRSQGGTRYTSCIVPYTIPEMLASRKATDVGVVLAVVLLGLMSFGLGRLSVLEDRKVPVMLCSAVEQAMTPVPNVAEAAPQQTAQQSGYVASKNGTAYHFPWCSGAQRIKEENKVWFASKAEAEAAGYRPASTCKGL